MKILSNDRCLYCKQKETLEHLLYKYVFLQIEVYQLNQDQVNWGRQLCDLENKSITLGKAKKKYKLIHIIIMATKMIIHSKRKSTSKLHLKQVKLVMKDLIQIERYWAEINSKLAIVLGEGHSIPQLCIYGLIEDIFSNILMYIYILYEQYGYMYYPHYMIVPL